MSNKDMTKNHKIERFDNLMYDGCEPHWHCVQCNGFWPFHCYPKACLEQMKCPAFNEVKQDADGA